MQLWKFNIVLVVLVFSFDHIRSAPQHYDLEADLGVNDSDEGVNDANERVNYDDQGVDDADEGVNDADQGVDDANDGVNDADEGVNDADEGVGNTADKVCLQEHEVYERCKDNCPDNCINYWQLVLRPCTRQCNAGCDCKKGYVRSLNDHKCIKPEQCHKTPFMGPYSGSGLAVQKAPISDQCKPGQYFYTKGCNICYCYADGTQGCTDIVCKMDSKLTLFGSPKQMQAYKKLRDTATSCVPGETFKSNGCNCNCVIPSVMTCDKNCVSQ